MKVKEVHKLTQQSVSGVIEDVTELCSSIVSELGEKVFAQLELAGIETDDLPGLNQLFSNASQFSRPFEGLDTYHHQLTFYRQNFGLIVC